MIFLVRGLGVVMFVIGTIYILPLRLNICIHLCSRKLPVMPAIAPFVERSEDVATREAVLSKRKKRKNSPSLCIKIQALLCVYFPTFGEVDQDAAVS